MTISKATLLALVKDRGSLSLKSIHTAFGVNPQDERDRVKVWRIGQGLAELHRGGWIDLEVFNGQRYAEAR